MTKVSPAISIQNLEFTYQADHQTILDIPTLEIMKGEKVFLHGPSGSGKSTLLNILSGVSLPTKGKLSILGQDITTLTTRQRDRFRGEHFGIIFQQFNLLPYLSVEENIILPTKLCHKKFNQSEFHKKKKEIISDLGIENLLHKKIYQLSIGQQQRVAAARALIAQPEIVIADEPTSSLDSNNCQEFMKRLMHEWEKLNFTLVLVSHDDRLKPYFEKQIEISKINRISTC